MIVEHGTVIPKEQVLLVWKDLSLNPPKFDLRLREGSSDVLRITFVSREGKRKFK